MGEAELRVNQSRKTALGEVTLHPEKAGEKICKKGLDNSGNIEGPRLSSMTCRFCGEPVTRLRRTTRWQGARVVGLLRHRTSVRHGVGYRKGNRRGGRWRQGVGGLHRSHDVGEQGRPWTRPSQGGPCRCDLVKGPMVNALTLGAMSLGLGVRS
jgi:hypothetical protein